MGISLQQFEQMKGRLGAAASRRGKARSAASPDVPVPSQKLTHEVILGVDPSLRGTGFGVLRAGKSQSAVLAQGTIACPKEWEHSRCLFKIATTLRDVIREHQPTVCIIEGLFFAQNLKTALIMGEARGAALCAIAEFGLEIYEVSPRKVKQAIVGYGAAQKIAVAKMVQRMLALAELPAPDAADALALALTYAQSMGRFTLLPVKRV